MHQLRAVSLVASLALSLLLSSAHASRAADTIGSVKNVRGTATVVRAGETIPAHPGLGLLAGDILETGSDGALGLTLRDDSLLSLGPSSRIALEKFQFAPAEGNLGLTTRIVRGTFAYLSGLIGKLAPDATTFVTPVATIGVRGTRFAVRISE